jgi:hypothetical protein
VNGASLRFLPPHKQKVWDARKLSETIRLLQFIRSGLSLTEVSQQEAFMQQHLDIILQRSVPTQHWRGEVFGDFVFPYFSLEIVIDFEEQ